MRRAALATLLLAAAVAAATPAQASSSPRRCGNVRFDMELKPDDKGLFGAFRIRATHVTCANARSIATRYVLHPDGVTRRSTPIGRWTCSWRAVPVAQQVYATCRRGTARITFVDKIPNG